MKQTKAPVTLKTLAAEDIYHLAEPFTRDRPRPKTTRGRNSLYPEALILTLVRLRTARRLSDHQRLFCILPEALPDQPVPALGALLYRPQTIPDERWVDCRMINELWCDDWYKKRPSVPRGVRCVRVHANPRHSGESPSPSATESVVRQAAAPAPATQDV
jgi:hypothetical protein